MVLALAPEGIAEEERRLAESTALNVEVIDPATHESMLRLAEAGLIALPGGELRELYPACGAERSESDGRILRAKALTDRAEHKLKAAMLLVGGGFAEEARAPAVEAARLAVAALAAMRGKARARRRRVGRGVSARGGAGRDPRRPAARCDTGPVGRRAGGRRSGTNRGVRVPHFLDGRGHVRSIAPRGGVAASAGHRRPCIAFTISSTIFWVPPSARATSMSVEHSPHDSQAGLRSCSGIRLGRVLPIGGGHLFS